MKQFMVTIPDSLLESARMDGAGEMKTFWTIAMPCVKPAWLTLDNLLIPDSLGCDRQYVHIQ